MTTTSANDALLGIVQEEPAAGLPVAPGERPVGAAMSEAMRSRQARGED